MKRFASVLLAVVLILSLSVFAFADSVPPIEQTPFYVEMEYIESNGIVPYSLVPVTDNLFYNSTYGGLSAFGQLTKMASVPFIDGVASGTCDTNYFNFFGSNYQYFSFGRQATTTTSPNTYYWLNFIGKITDGNGVPITPSDFNGTYEMLFCLNSSTNLSSNSAEIVGQVVPNLNGNFYLFEDGYFQVALVGKTRSSFGSVTICLGSIASALTGPFTFEIEALDFYAGEASDSVPPFTFGDGAHSSTPPAPEVRDPNDAAQYGSAQDQVQWYNDAFGGAVDPELDNKIVAGNDMLLQQEEIEQDVIADFQQYSSQVDPANITFPTAVLNGMSFIGSTFMSSYNNLGDISFVISLSMMIGVVLVLIGRGEGALARGMSASSRERRRIEYASERDMKKGG